MIAVLGIGGAGGNIADESSRLGFQTGVINFSTSDLDSLIHVEKRLKLLGSEGVGHNRDEAIRLLQNNWETALNFVRENFSNPSIEVIIVTFSTGGGSGSGIAPFLLEILTNEFPNKTFVAMPIIPDKTEVVSNQMNCLQTFEELSKIDICIMPIDNEKIRHEVNAKNLLYKTINERTVHLIDELLSYTTKTSKNGNLDKRDLLSILNTKGIGIIAKTDISKFNNDVTFNEETVTEKIQNSWKNSVFAPIENNRVMKAGIVLDAEESFMEFLNYKSMFEMFDKGMPIDLFEGNYHEKRGTILSILTGTSWINSRLNEVSKLIAEKEQHIEEMFEESENQNYKATIKQEFSSRLRTKPTQTKKSVTDILSKWKR
jgi:cell division GTPase FtsZ